ncbi:hypothetical protein HPP92_008788 [Vanilla planifolia]|uniref:WRKY domain-containing protein n=1 Tax=Vanilla planifolia TaxID=51239 RepID=A0A835R9F9_VANPL|nr:hypothetical protein HPP92_008788 [Vanilla planifolia]
MLPWFMAALLEVIDRSSMLSSYQLSDFFDGDDRNYSAGFSTRRQPEHEVYDYASVADSQLFHESFLSCPTKPAKTEPKWASKADEQRTEQLAINGNGEKRKRDKAAFRIGFRTKSEVEIMDDGFKWRKYGKKAVKNSPSPRNYYRCTSPFCGVKKRVERDRNDPNYVITTYEGTHNHENPDSNRPPRSRTKGR